MTKQIIIRPIDDITFEVARFPYMEDPQTNLENITKAILAELDVKNDPLMDVMERVTITKGGHVRMIGEVEGRPYKNSYVVFIEKEFNLNELNNLQKKRITDVSYNTWDTPPERTTSSI